jgi:hypothetical protein
MTTKPTGKLAYRSAQMPRLLVRTNRNGSEDYVYRIQRRKRAYEFKLGPVADPKEAVPVMIQRSVFYLDRAIASGQVPRDAFNGLNREMLEIEREALRAAMVGDPHRLSREHQLAVRGQIPGPGETVDQRWERNTLRDAEMIDRGLRPEGGDR